MLRDIINKIKTVGRSLPLVPTLYCYLVQLPSNAVKRGLLLGSERLDDDEKEWTKENQLKWRKFDSVKHIENSDGYVLVETLVNSLPSFYFHGSIVGKYLGREKNLKTLFLLRNFYDSKVKRICQSYYPDGFIYLNPPGANIWLKIRSFFEARRIYKRLTSGEELLSLEYEGLPIGGLIYDDYLIGTREGTLSKITPEVFGYIYKAIIGKKCYENIFRRYNVKALVIGDVVFSKLGVLAMVALQNNAEVYVQRPLPPNIIRVRKYQSLEEIRTYQYRPSEALVECKYREYKDDALKSIDLYMHNRMNLDMPALDRVDVQNAYSSDKALVSREEIIEQLGLDAEKPIAVIMSHALIDAPHGHRWALFQDFLVWLRETLNFVKDHPETNWLVKPHPSANLYKCKQNEWDELEQITRGISGHTIKLLPNETNTKSLLEFADVIITVCGTGGLEFSCFGIPCILAGESPYSGFGFTMEPKSKEEYFGLLSNINTIKKLNKEQMERAKLVAYLLYLARCRDYYYFARDAYYTHA